jgi:hypothetical protein
MDCLFNACNVLFSYGRILINSKLMAMYNFVLPFLQATFCGVTSCVFDKLRLCRGWRKVAKHWYKQKNLLTSPPVILHEERLRNLSALRGIQIYSLVYWSSHWTVYRVSHLTLRPQKILILTRTKKKFRTKRTQYLMGYTLRDKIF